jgi:hypothetical protein
MLNERFEAGPQRYAVFTEDLVEAVLSRGGTLKAEHGTGRVMAPFVRRQYGDELYAVMRELKRLCDPAGTLNPGVLLTASATRDEAAAVKAGQHTSHASVNRTCEIGMTRATGQPYHHLLELLDQVTS